MLNEGVLLLLRKRPGWDEALGSLQGLYQSHGDGANARAAEYASLYRGNRAAMVFDVVASRQRRYVPRVLPLVAEFQATPAAASLSSLAKLGPPKISLRKGEGETMRDVAAGLIRFGADSGHGNDDAAVEAWAASVAPLEFAPALDPYVGAVTGIGIALFCYLRMRAGADALKPDVRVRQALGRFGFDIPDGEAALLVTASALAEELGVSRLVLDQLLWWGEGT